MFGSGSRALLPALALLLALPTIAAAQDATRDPFGPALYLGGGASSYDLSGTGTAPVGSLLFAVPVSRMFVVEPAVGYLTYDAQVGVRVHHVTPEIQLQVQRPGERVRPYLGVGVGLSWGIVEGEDATDGTLSGAAGVRVRAGSAWILRGELRVRAIDPWVGTTADWTVGAGYRF